MSTSPLTVEVPTDAEKIISQTQYGVRWPNDEITWGLVDLGSGYRNIHITDLIPGAPGVSIYSKENWDKLMKDRAEKAMMGLDTYTALHKFVKRTVVLAVTAPEEV
jgi:hypothetical protein